MREWGATKRGTAAWRMWRISATRRRRWLRVKRCACNSLVSCVDLCRIEDSLGNDLRPVRRHLPEEAALKTFVACGAAVLADFEEDSVDVAVDEDGLDFLEVSAFFPFAPKSVAAAAEVDRPAG